MARHVDTPRDFSERAESIAVMEYLARSADFDRIYLTGKGRHGIAWTRVDVHAAVFIRNARITWKRI